MRLFHKRLRVVWAACIVLLPILVPRAESQEAMTDLRVALDYYDDGQLKTELIASTARVVEEGDIDATGVVFRSVTPEGKTEMTLKVASCVCNRENQTARSDAPVSMERTDVTITGTGMRWNGDAQKVKLLSDVRVVMTKGLLSRKKDQPNE